MDATQIVLIVLIVALIVIYPIMIYSRNKKQRAQMQEQTNSLKRGDRVLTASGVYGTIVDLHQEGDKTIVTIETGMGNNKGYIALDAYAIYSIIRDEEPAQEIKEDAGSNIETTEPEVEVTPVEEAVADEKTEEAQESTTEELSVEEKPKKKSKKK